MTREDRVRAAALAFATAAVAGYALLRLGAAIAGEPDPRGVGPSVHVPYYWRVATAVWWGALAAAAGWRWPRLEFFFRAALPVAVLILVGVAVLRP